MNSDPDFWAKIKMLEVEFFMSQEILPEQKKYSFKGPIAKEFDLTFSPENPTN